MNLGRIFRKKILGEQEQLSDAVPAPEPDPAASSFVKVVDTNAPAAAPPYTGPPINLVVLGTGRRALFLINLLIRTTRAPVARLVLGDSTEEGLKSGEQEVRYTLERYPREGGTIVETVLLRDGADGAEDRVRALALPESTQVINEKWNKWCLVASINAHHRKDVLQALNAGYSIFCEKPLATTIVDCLAIYEAVVTTQTLTPAPRFLTGFVLRYAPLYQRIRTLLREEKFTGKIITCEFNELLGREHGSYKFRNWRRFKDLAGPNVLEKSCHDMDLMCWLLDDIPSKVAAFGGKNIFTEENVEAAERIKDEVQAKGGPRQTVFRHWPVYPPVEDPFTSGGDAEDNVIAVIQFRSGIRATFHLSSMCAFEQRRILLSGLEGAIEADLQTGDVRTKKVSSEFSTTENHKSTVAGDNHGGGDEWQIRQWWDEMVAVGSEMHPSTSRNGGETAADGDRKSHMATVKDMLVSSVMALAIETARLEERTVDLDNEIWKRIGI